ncbi:hypothetical protein BLOT_003642 [Blomia tropicalis]|nr:hypothetical protein BLOT_003642 [Blomia tropicalis]
MMTDWAFGFIHPHISFFSLQPNSLLRINQNEIVFIQSTHNHIRSTFGPLSKVNFKTMRKTCKKFTSFYVQEK